MDILDGLNEQQKCAVTSTSPVLQVLAPPGSGKTKTLTSRVAHLISQQGLRPWNIVVCTFTLKAAREMKQRIQSFIGPEAESKLILGTFHSICRRYISRYGHYLGIAKQFGIADSSDSLAILKRLIKRHGFEIEASKARSRISRRKSNVAVVDARAGPRSVEAQEFEQLYDLYENSLKSSNLLDYDDLLLRCVDLLKQHPECCANIQAILVDEFQDTNTVQYELINLLAQHGRLIGNRMPPSITIVGDPDQSIYSFRSAEIKNLLHMQQRYTDTQIVMLEQNYRSAGAIIDCAMQVIEQDVARPQKKMQSTHGHGTMPVLRELEDPKQEALWTVRELKRLTSITGGILQYSDFAILLRSASLSRLIESELGIAGVPYRMVGGHRFFDRKEVKLLLDYMRVISQPEHTEALLRIINEPSRKIGDVTVKALIDHVESNHWTLWGLIRKIVQKDYQPPEKLSKQAYDGLTTFFNIITRGQMKLDNLNVANDSLGILLDYIAQAIGLEAYLKKESQDKETLENRMENVHELRIQAEATLVQEDPSDLEDISQAELDTMPEFSSAGQAALSKFLTNVALATDSQAVEAQIAPDMVTISTIHAAKGLEWPVVFIPALYQGSIPHSRAEDNDEERRLLYVGMTRAQGLLYMSWPTQKSKDEYNCLSSFLAPDSIRKKFRHLGPSLDTYEGIVSLSMVLGKDCPSIAKIQQSRDSCQHPYDMGFLDERGHHERTQMTSNIWQANNVAYQSAQSWQNHNHQKKSGSMARSTVYTHSYNRVGDNNRNNGNNIGFSSARTLDRDPPVTMKRSSSDEYAERKDAKRFKQSPTKKQKKGLAGQGTLTAFLAAPQIAAATMKAEKVIIAKPGHSDMMPLSLMQRNAVSGSNASFNKPQNTLLHRSIRSAKSTPQPVIVHEEDNNSMKSGQASKYILLSSSPPPAYHTDGDENAHVPEGGEDGGAVAKDTLPTNAATMPCKPPAEQPRSLVMNSRPGFGKTTHMRRLGTGARGMKSWSDIQREKQANRTA